MPDPVQVYDGDWKTVKMDWGFLSTQRTDIAGKLSIFRLAPQKIRIVLSATSANWSETADFQAKVIAEVYAERGMIVSIEVVVPNAPGRGGQPYPVSRGGASQVEMELPDPLGVQLTKIRYKYFDFKDRGRAPMEIEAAALAIQLVPRRV